MAAAAVVAAATVIHSIASSCCFAACLFVVIVSYLVDPLWPQLCVVHPLTRTLQHPLTRTCTPVGCTPSLVYLQASSSFVHFKGPVLDVDSAASGPTNQSANLFPARQLHVQ